MSPLLYKTAVFVLFFRVVQHLIMRRAPDSNERAEAGWCSPNPSRETRFSGAKEGREKLFSCSADTRRIDKPCRIGAQAAESDGTRTSMCKARCLCERFVRMGEPGSKDGKERTGRVAENGTGAGAGVETETGGGGGGERE